MLSPYFKEKAIFREKKHILVKKSIFHIFQRKIKFRSFQRFLYSFHIRAQNSFQSWKNAIFCLNTNFYIYDMENDSYSSNRKSWGQRMNEMSISLTSENFVNERGLNIPMSPWWGISSLGSPWSELSSPGSPQWWISSLGHGVHDWGHPGRKFTHRGHPGG